MFYVTISKNLFILSLYRCRFIGFSCRSAERVVCYFTVGERSQIPTNVQLSPRQHSAGVSTKLLHSVRRIPWKRKMERPEASSQIQNNNGKNCTKKLRNYVSNGVCLVVGIRFIRNSNSGGNEKGGLEHTKHIGKWRIFACSRINLTQITI